MAIKLLIICLIPLIGCANIGRGLRSAGTTMSTPSSEPDPFTTNDQYRNRAVSKNGIIVGHETNGRILYNDGTSGQIQ